MHDMAAELFLLDPAQCIDPSVGAYRNMHLSVVAFRDWTNRVRLQKHQLCCLKHILEMSRVCLLVCKNKTKVYYQACQLQYRLLPASGVKLMWYQPDSE